MRDVFNDVFIAEDPAALSWLAWVVLIIFVFLRNFRATIIPGLAIPTSITAAFAILYVLGFSINNFTLLALILAMGIVVDDAIIVMENAYRHQEDLGEAPMVAATMLNSAPGKVANKNPPVRVAMVAPGSENATITT